LTLCWNSDTKVWLTKLWLPQVFWEKILVSYNTNEQFQVGWSRVQTFFSALLVTVTGQSSGLRGLFTFFFPVFPYHDLISLGRIFSTFFPKPWPPSPGLFSPLPLGKGTGKIGKRNIQIHPFLFSLRFLLRFMIEGMYLD
jgi:hypothetical protein